MPRMPEPKPKADESTLRVASYPIVLLVSRLCWAVGATAELTNDGSINLMGKKRIVFPGPRGESR
jgi:hypothetical protein